MNFMIKNSDISITLLLALAIASCQAADNNLVGLGSLRAQKMLVAALKQDAQKQVAHFLQESSRDFKNKKKRIRNEGPETPHKNLSLQKSPIFLKASARAQTIVVNAKNQNAENQAKIFMKSPDARKWIKKEERRQERWYQFENFTLVQPETPTPWDSNDYHWLRNNDSSVIRRPAQLSFRYGIGH